MKRAAVLLAGMAILAPGPGAVAFGTLTHLGQDAEHGHITRLALACPDAGPDCLQPKSLALLIGDDGDRGAVSVPDLSAMAFRSRAHCDNGDFLPTPGYAQSAAEARATLETCRAWMDRQIDEAVVAAAGLGGADPAAAKREAMAHFGVALHAAQDFYAHTNWADRPDPARPVGPANPPGLGHAEPAPWIALRGDVPFPEGLISGCFKAKPERAFCNSGPGGRVKHADLNKDEGPIEPALGRGRTPRGAVEGNFERAVTAAIADSRDKWAVLRERLAARYGPEQGARMACLLSRDAPQDCAAP